MSEQERLFLSASCVQVNIHHLIGFRNIGPKEIAVQLIQFSTSLKLLRSQSETVFGEAGCEPRRQNSAKYIEDDIKNQIIKV